MEEVKKLIGEAEIQLEEARTLLEKDFYRGTVKFVANIKSYISQLS